MRDDVQRRLDVLTHLADVPLEAEVCRTGQAALGEEPRTVGRGRGDGMRVDEKRLAQIDRSDRLVSMETGVYRVLDRDEVVRDRRTR